MCTCVSVGVTLKDLFVRNRTGDDPDFVTGLESSASPFVPPFTRRPLPVSLYIRLP